MDTKHWLTLADRLRAEGAYDYAEFARDLAAQLTWPGALDVATALRSFVYGQPGGSDLQRVVEPLYRRLGWQQSALVACWFRDSRNWPSAQHKKRPDGSPAAERLELPTSGRRPGGWPTAAATPDSSQP